MKLSRTFAHHLSVSLLFSSALFGGGYGLAGGAPKERGAEEKGQKRAVQRLKTKQDLANLFKNHKRVVLDIGASWCGACKGTEQPFEEAIRLNAERVGAGSIEGDEKEFRGIHEFFNIQGYPTFISVSQEELPAPGAGEVARGGPSLIEALATAKDLANALKSHNRVILILHKNLPFEEAELNGALRMYSGGAKAYKLDVTKPAFKDFLSLLGREEGRPGVLFIKYDVGMPNSPSDIDRRVGHFVKQPSLDQGFKKVVSHFVSLPRREEPQMQTEEKARSSPEQPQKRRRSFSRE